MVIPKDGCGGWLGPMPPPATAGRTFRSDCTDVSAMGVLTTAFDLLPAAARDRVAYKLLKRTSRIRRSKLTDLVIGFTDCTVQTGPFAGLAMMPKFNWRDYYYNLAPILLGTFEQDLFDSITDIIAAKPKTIINVGCAEGYYAVRLARAIPDADVIAFDPIDVARTACRQLAELNGVRIDVRGECRADVLQDILEGPATLIVDCEGAELEMLRPDVVPALRTCDILVECHDMIIPEITPTLLERFGESHVVERIDEGPRPSTAHPQLSNMTSLNRWLAVCEFRGAASHWLMMKPRQGAVGGTQG